MKNERATVEAIQERMQELGKLLSQLADDQEAVRDLADAFSAGDPVRFKTVLERTFGGFPLPADKCDPYVRGFILVIEPPEFVRVCTWVRTTSSITELQSEEIVRTVSGEIASDRLLELLERLGLIKCEWVRQERTDIREINKFVQGVCPPGTF